MKRTRIKICGIRRIEDAKAAAELGCDAIGLNFYRESPRFLEPRKAADVCKQLPAFLTRVALFVDADIDWVEEVLHTVPVDILQFHGAESEHFCVQFGLPYIKAIAVSQHDQVKDVEAKIAQYPQASSILLDTFHGKLKGGSGESFDWTVIPETRRSSIILAGGLNAQNVEQAITHVRPYAVDVSSGVESVDGEKGIKDVQKLKQFVQAVMQTDLKLSNEFLCQK